MPMNDLYAAADVRHGLLVRSATTAAATQKLARRPSVRRLFMEGSRSRGKPQHVGTEVLRILKQKGMTSIGVEKQLRLCRFLRDCEAVARQGP